MTMAFVALAVGAAAAAASPESIVITAERPPSRAMPPVAELDEQQLLERQPRTAADAVKALPGVSVRTNSRGETIAQVRGSEERQTQLFLDGAPLAVPWDGRADIGLVPAGLIASVRATKGAVPIEYGTNAVAGAIDLRTRSGGAAGVRAMGGVGSLDFAEAAAVATLAAGPLDLTLAAAALTRDAEPVASLSALPFSQADSRRRTNSDLDSVSLFGAAAYDRGPIALRAALLHFDAERGIAPESDRDPAVNAPRYWRYPDIRQTQLNLGAELELSETSAVKFVGWRQWFDQTIVQYTDVTYSTERAREEDDDDTIGGRAVFSTAFAPLTLRLVGSAQTSRHAQVDQALPGAPGPRLIYRQNLYTIGGEADAPVGAGPASVGLAYDHSANPRTGDKPDHPDRGAPAFSAAYRLPLGEQWSLGVSGGRRNRFPSSRELFGEALGRFLPNPDLKPEQAWLADAELRLDRPRLTVQLNPFLSIARDTIAQRVVRVNGRNLRQRFNLSGSKSVGVDLWVAAQASDRLGLELGGTWLRARADAGAAAFRRLPQRPSYEVSAAAIFAPVPPLSLRAEFRRVGPAVDIDPGGSKARLSPGNEINLRGRWQVAQLRRGSRLALTASVENLTDDVITPQLGLPLPGRSLRVGLQLN
jgi:iron complex outermembrane receptor protein